MPSRPRLLQDPVARFVAATAVLGSLSDWTLFASLVALVDDRTSGSAWATAAVLLARVLPATVFAPIAARRVDRHDLRTTLGAHEFGRVIAVAALALLAPTSPLLVAAVLLVGLEFTAALLAAGRESLISRHVPAELHPAVNTATAVAGYGLLPVGAAVVQLVGAPTALGAAVIGYAGLLVSYLVAWPGTSTRPHIATAAGDTVATPAGVASAALARTVAAAAIGLAPIVAMFTVAPRLADHWLGDATATALPLGMLLAGAAVGLVLANRGLDEAAGLGTAVVGFAVAGAGLWQVGVPIAGVGAGLSYLALQTRLQAQASDPSQFARAFAVLKVATIGGTVAGPAAWGLGGATLLLASSTVAAGVACALVADPRPLLRRLVRRVVLAVVVVQVVGERRPGPAVVVSNHPNAIDGVVAMAVDPDLRPVARWQSHPIARAGFWLAEAVVTTAGTDRDHRPAFEQAADHLVGRGRIWLAPEGGAHTDHTLRPPRSGAVRMAHAAGVPVQALGIRHLGDPAGPRLARWRPWRRPTVVLQWGEVVVMTGDVARDNDRMMAAVARASGTRWAPLGLAAAA